MLIAMKLFSMLALGTLLASPAAADAVWPAKGKPYEQPAGNWDDRRPHHRHWGPPRGYYPPPPVYYAPPPRYYYAPPPRYYYAPPPVYYAPPPRFYRPGPPGVGLYFRF